MSKTRYYFPTKPNPSYQADLNKYLNTLSKQVSSQLTVLRVNENIPFMLHISRNKSIKEFVPRIGHNQAKSEDRTVPRLCVAATLQGCLLSFPDGLNYLLDRDPVSPEAFKSIDAKQKNNIYRGGYYIYAVPYHYALAPTSKLVYDVDKTGERWLINYNPATSSYPAYLIGELYFTNLSIGIDKHKRKFTLTTRVRTELPIYISDTQRVNAGCYELIGEAWTSIKDYKTIAVTPSILSESEYKRFKDLNISMLSIDSAQRLLEGW